MRRLFLTMHLGFLKIITDHIDGYPQKFLLEHVPATIFLHLIKAFHFKFSVEMQRNFYIKFYFQVTIYMYLRKHLKTLTEIFEALWTTATIITWMCVLQFSVKTCCS